MPEDLKTAIAFHGHLCPGLVIGYLAARLGLKRLVARRSQDEELIAIVENKSCAVDAVQVLTGCTFGKGNLFFRDFGKMVFTFAVRPSGRAIRVSLFSHAGSKPRRSGHERQEESREQRIRRMLSMKPEELFRVSETRIRLPRPASIHDSVLWEQCAEMVMATRQRRASGKVLCIPCSKNTRRRRGTAQVERCR